MNIPEPGEIDLVEMQRIYESQQKDIPEDDNVPIELVTDVYPDDI